MPAAAVGRAGTTLFKIFDANHCKSLHTLFDNELVYIVAADEVVEEAADVEDSVEGEEAEGSLHPAGEEVVVVDSNNIRIYISIFVSIVLYCIYISLV